MYTIPVGLASFNGEYEMNWEIVMTASCLGNHSNTVCFIILQKYIIKGIMLAGLKG